MSIFGFGTKKEEQKKPCCCGGSCTPEAMQAAEAEKKESGIKILGGGCAKCNALEAATVDALRELGMDTTIDHVKEYEKIAAYGVCINRREFAICTDFFRHFAGDFLPPCRDSLPPRQFS